MKGRIRNCAQMRKELEIIFSRELTSNLIGEIFQALHFHNSLENQPRNNAQHQKTEKSQLETLDPRERPHKQDPLENPKSENQQDETTPQNPHPIVGTQKANCIQAIEQERHTESDLVTHLNLTF
jgi:hydroxymethylpyrimidine pyrophosphatase-like HAD family hydrolase